MRANIVSKLAIAFAIVVLSTQLAGAADVTVKFDDAAQKMSEQLPAVLDNCVSGILLRKDEASCRGVSTFLYALVNEIHTAQAKAAEDAKQQATGLPKPAEPGAKRRHGPYPIK